MESELMYGDKGEVRRNLLYPLGKAMLPKKVRCYLVGFGKIMKVVNAAAAELEKKASMQK